MKRLKDTHIYFIRVLRVQSKGATGTIYHCSKDDPIDTGEPNSYNDLEKLVSFEFGNIIMVDLPVTII